MNFDLLEDKRKERRLTILQLCNAIGVDESTYYKWKANPDRMKLSTANKIVEVLEFTNEEKDNLFA